MEIPPPGVLCWRCKNSKTPRMDAVRAWPLPLRSEPESSLGVVPVGGFVITTFAVGARLHRTAGFASHSLQRLSPRRGRPEYRPVAPLRLKAPRHMAA